MADSGEGHGDIEKALPATTTTTTESAIDCPHTSISAPASRYEKQNCSPCALLTATFCFSLFCIVPFTIILGVNYWAIEAQSWPEVKGTLTRAVPYKAICSRYGACCMGTSSCPDYCVFFVQYTPTAANGEESKIYTAREPSTLFGDAYPVGGKTFETRMSSYSLGDKGYDCDPGGDIMIKYNPGDPSIAEASDSLDQRTNSVIAAWVLCGVAGLTLVICLWQRKNLTRRWEAACCDLTLA